MLASRAATTIGGVSDPKERYPDPLVRQRVFPEPAQVFAFSPVHLKEALQTGVVVVDTNVLLVPYTTGPASLDQIRQTFERLARDDRLRVPGQVAREFADNRAEKLKTLFQQLSRKREISLPRSQYSLLEGIPAYKDITTREDTLIAALEEYRKAIGGLLDTIAMWQWDDPVSQIYRELFKPSTVIEPEIDRENLLEELKYRQGHRIPPGYKDAGNEYSGIGDLLIWKAILKIGKTESRHLIFVSGDEKTDWRYQSEKRALYPRIELLDEYRIASSGNSLLMITFAELLEQFDVPAPVVAEVRKEEAVVTALGSAEPSRMGLSQDFEQRLGVASLPSYLRDRYPEREHTGGGELLELLQELSDCRIYTVGQLDNMLRRSAAAFEVSEAEDPPSFTEDGLHQYADVGVVRRSLAIVDEEYRNRTYRVEDARFRRWRRLLL